MKTLFMIFLSAWTALSLLGCGGGSQGFEVVDKYSIDMGYGLCITEPFLYVTTNDGVRIFDVENPQEIKPVQSINIGHPSFTVIVDHGVAYVGGETGFTIIDVSKPENAEVLGRYENGGSVYDLSFRDNCIYLADEFRGLEIVDVEDAAKPEPVSQMETGNGSRNLVIIGDIMYLANINKGLLVLDISDTAEPVLLKTVEDSPGARNFFIDGDTLYMGTYNHGVRVFDISDVENPEFQWGFLEPEEINVLSVHNGIVYCSGPGRKISVWDVSDIEKPVEIAYYNAGLCHGAVYHNGLLYFAGKAVNILKPLPQE